MEVAVEAADLEMTSMTATKILAITVIVVLGWFCVATVHVATGFPTNIPFWADVANVVVCAVYGAIVSSLFRYLFRRIPTE